MLGGEDVGPARAEVARQVAEKVRIVLLFVARQLVDPPPALRGDDDQPRLAMLAGFDLERRNSRCAHPP